MIDIENLLKKHNLKITKQRKEILKIINELDIEATIKNIKEKISIDKSTMYRIIDLLIKENIIEKNINYNDEIYYSIKEEHKHYIKCIKCHKKEEIDVCPINNVKKKGYEIINHKIEIDGICNECINK